MKLHTLTATIALAVGACSAASAATQWQLTWGDEFDYTGAPDSTKWGYELGAGIRNGEAQNYTSRPENVRVENGMLVIEARKESYQGSSYTSASIQTLSDDHTQIKFATTGGRLEVRAKVPSMAGCWPAFWTMGTSTWGINSANTGWPKGGEIDIMEFMSSNAHVVWGGAHYANAYGYHADNMQPYDMWWIYPIGQLISDDFHTFRIDWYADRIEWYFDNHKYNQLMIDSLSATGNPFSNPHYLILNMALGGSLGGAIDPGFTSQQYQVDCVRVYQQVATPEPGTLGIGALALIALLRRK